MVLDSNKKTLGIIGGGQLGMFLSKSAKKFDLNVVILEKFDDCSAKTFCDQLILGNSNDEKKLMQLFSISDFVIYENENIELEPILKASLKYPNKLIQGLLPLYIAQDRLIEKTFLNNLGIKTAPFFLVESFYSLMASLSIFGNNSKAILKSRKLGYDGKGQISIDSKKIDIKNNEIKELIKQGCIVESFVDLDFEISLIGTYKDNKVTNFLPITKNEHINGILFSSEIIKNKKLQSEAENIFKSIIQHFDKSGILTIEFFVTKQKELLVNELAPRVHNSGHHSLDNFKYSQFDLQIANILQKHLDNKQINALKMYNILGKDYNKYLHLKNNKSVIFYDYLKKEITPGRKMAHINAPIEMKWDK